MSDCPSTNKRRCPDEWEPLNGKAPPICDDCKKREAHLNDLKDKAEAYMTFWGDPICFDCYLLTQDNDPEY